MSNPSSQTFFQEVSSPTPGSTVLSNSANGSGSTYVPSPNSQQQHLLPHQHHQQQQQQQQYQHPGSQSNAGGGGRIYGGGGTLPRLNTTTSAATSSGSASVSYTGSPLHINPAQHAANNNSFAGRAVAPSGMLVGQNSTGSNSGLGAAGSSSSNFMVSAQSATTFLGRESSGGGGGGGNTSAVGTDAASNNNNNNNTAAEMRSVGGSGSLPNSFQPRSHPTAAGGGGGSHQSNGTSRSAGGSGTGLGQRTCRVGEYELGKDLGSGATSHVRMCRHIPSGQTYAAKIIPRGDPSEEENLKREVRALSNIDHEHVIKYRQLLLSTNNFYVVMEAALGGDLLNLLLNTSNKAAEGGGGGGGSQQQQDCSSGTSGVLPISEVRRMFGQLVRGLTACHMAKVAHRDLKPDNILITRENNIKLSDFGMCRFHHGRHQAKPEEYSHTFVGTLEYSAPEVIAAAGYDGFRADMWSLGCVLHAMLSGKFPFGFQPTRQEQVEVISSGQYLPLPPGTDPVAEDLVRKLIVVDPAKRLTCMEVMNHDFIKSGAAAAAASSSSSSVPVVPVAASSNNGGGDSSSATRSGTMSSNSTASSMAASPLHQGMQRQQSTQAYMPQQQLQQKPMMPMDSQQQRRVSSSGGGTASANSSSGMIPNVNCGTSPIPASVTFVGGGGGCGGSSLGTSGTTGNDSSQSQGPSSFNSNSFNTNAGSPGRGQRVGLNFAQAQRTSGSNPVPSDEFE